MNLQKIKELMKTRKAQTVSGVVAGVLLIGAVTGVVLHNKKISDNNKMILSNEEVVFEDETTDNINDENVNENTNESEENSDVVVKENEDGEIVATDKEGNVVATGQEAKTLVEKTSNTSAVESKSKEDSTIKKEDTKSQKDNVVKPTHEHTHNWEPVYKTVNHEAEGHYENMLVKAAWTESIPVYEEKARSICNGCGADITGNTNKHNESHALNGEKGGWHTEYKKVQTGTNTINHDAVYEKKWVVDKPAWTETVNSGYKCNSCGATK